MKVYSFRVACLCGTLLAPCLPSAWSQAVPPASKPAEEPVSLPQFVITETTANPYLSRQALSASRVAMDIQDIP
jgi:iron complex outermembrane recepter protein